MRVDRLGRNSGTDNFGPEDHALLAWAFDPATMSSGTALATAGTVYVVKLRIRGAMSVTNIVAFNNVNGSTLTVNQCWAGLYQNGSLLGTSADQSTAWLSTGTKTMAITGGPVILTPGYAYVAYLFNGTTGPGFGRHTGLAAGNLGLATTASRFGTADTGRTTLPSTLGTISALSVGYWAGLS